MKDETMKKASLTLIAALAAAAAVAAPAFAQPYGPPPPPRPSYGPPPPVPGGWDIDRRIQWTQDRINHGAADGSLDRHEFRRVQGQLNGIRHDEQRARWHNGGRLDDRARDILSDRLNHLNDEIHWLRDNGPRRPW
jgi:hypothetical protein